MNFYVNFAMGDKQLENTFARITAPDYPEAVAMIKARRGRDYGFVYTQEEFDGIPQKPWWNPETRVIGFDQVPPSGKAAKKESRTYVPKYVSE